MICILQTCVAEDSSSLGTLPWIPSPANMSDRSTVQCCITAHEYWSQLPVSGPHPVSSYWLPGPLLCGKRRHKSSWASVFPLEVFLLPKLDKLLWCPPEEYHQPWHTPGDCNLDQILLSQIIIHMLLLIKNAKVQPPWEGWGLVN